MSNRTVRVRDARLFENDRERRTKTMNVAGCRLQPWGGVGAFELESKPPPPPSLAKKAVETERMGESY